MKQLLYSLLLTLLTISNAPGQQRITLYYNDKWELTSIEKSAYKREIGIDLKDMVFDGDYRDYNGKGEVIGDGSYIKGDKTGIHKVYKDRVLVSAIEYSNKEFTITELADANGNMLVTNGTGKFTIPYSYFENFFELRQWMDGVLTGQFQNGKRVGTWIYNGKHDYEEIYDNGILIKRTAKQRDIKNSLDLVISPVSFETEKFNFDKKVFKNLYSVFESYPIQNTDSVQRNITYPGGIKKLLYLITLDLEFPKEDRMKGIQGKVVVSLTIDEHGNVKNHQIIKSLSPNYDKEALRVIKQFENKLCPALSNGKPYESILSIPITFSLR